MSGLTSTATDVLGSSASCTGFLSVGCCTVFLSGFSSCGCAPVSSSVDETIFCSFSAISGSDSIFLGCCIGLSGVFLTASTGGDFFSTFREGTGVFDFSGCIFWAEGFLMQEFQLSLFRLFYLPCFPAVLPVFRFF